MSSSSDVEEGEGSSQAPSGLKRTRSAAGDSDAPRCGKHSLPLDVYCCTDDQIICSQCASVSHWGHSIGMVGKERGIKQGNLKKMQTQYTEVIRRHEKHLEDYRKMCDEIREQARKAEDSSEEAIVYVIDSLQRRFLSVLELIRGQEEAAVTQVNRLCQSLLVKLKEMKRREARLSSLAETQSNAHFLQQWSSLRLICEKDLEQTFPEVSQDSLLPFTRIKDAVWDLKQRLEEFCEEEFASLPQNDLPVAHDSPTEQDAEPETREEFLQYARDLSLDPATAHNDLIVSDGDKEVKSEKGKRPALRSPERFTHRRQVLCREGLQDERCYYEVEVKGDKAEIALAYKGINRKSATRLSALGGNAKSWSLDISSKYSVSHNSDSVELATHRNHPRIGVYLQFKEGALSFYEVADDMKFLYKVEAEFTEPLYPAFWLGDECCIKICDLSRS